MQQIYYKQNETFETEFFKDKECTQLITDWSEYKNIYIELKNGNITPLCVLKDITTPIDIFCGYIHRNVKGFNRIQTLDDITPNLSKYIPEDNAVLFLSEEDCNKLNTDDLDAYFIYPHGLLPRIVNSEMDITDYKKLTIFLPHITQETILKANEVAKELEEKYGVIEVNVFGLHCFVNFGNIDWRFNFLRNIIEDEENKKGIWHGDKFGDFVYSKIPERVFINKIITTNSTGILEPQESNTFQVIDCKEIFEEYLKNN